MGQQFIAVDCGRQLSESSPKIWHIRDYIIGRALASK